MFGPTAWLDLGKPTPGLGKSRLTSDILSAMLASKISAETLAANTWTHLLLKPSEGAVK